MINIDKLKKSKKGSGLIIVIMVFAFLSIVGMAFISMSLSSYKLRIAKSNAKTGLYGAESGIDEAYGIIGNKVDESITKGDEQVNEFVKEVNLIIQNPEEKIDEKGNFQKLNHMEWENYYKLCIDKKDEPQIKNDKKTYIYTLKDNEFKKCQNKIFKLAYKENILGSESDNGIVYELNNEDNYKFNIQEDGNKEIPKIVAEGKEATEKEKNKLITINIKSNFIHKGIPKEITTNYDVYIPDYNKVYYKEIENKSIPKYPIIEKNVLVNGSMDVQGETKVKGNIYVKGKNSINENRGIILNSSKDVTFGGKVATPEDFKFIGKTKCMVEGDLFAKNVQIKENAPYSTLNVKNASMYTKDDLEIDASGSEVLIDGAYYGLSDGSESSTADKSSSININAVDNMENIDCLLKIRDLKNEGSIIMGTSYADFIKNKEEKNENGELKKDEEKKYQTGESLSIKGNYKAYSFPLIYKDQYKDDKYYKKLLDVEYEYYKFIKNPEYPHIAFVDKFLNGDKLNVFDKSKYFKYICEDEDYSELINKGNNKKDKNNNMEKGVYINWKPNKKNDISIGAIVSKGNLYESTYNLDNQIQDKVKAVTEMYKEETSEKKKFINKKEIVENYETKNLTNIIIKNKSVCSKELEKLLSKDEASIVIIDGDLTVDSDFKFTGILIVTENLTINNGGKLDITEDKEGIMNLIWDNYKILKDIFVDDGIKEKDNFESKESIGIVDKEVIIKKDNLIQMKNWKIIK
ncbi:hypothetical protein [Clostridium novyi]